MYKVRYIERVGTPGRVLSVESDDELKTLTKGCKLYKNGVEIQSPEDGCTMIRVPKGGGDAASKADLDTMQRGQDNFSKVNDAKTANSVRGSKNQFRDGRIPIVLGEHRLTPDLIGKPYTTYGQSNEQYLHQLFCLGYNNVKIIDNSEKIGDMPISEDHRIVMDSGTTHYNRLVSELSVGEKIEEDPVFRITPEHTTQITVGISFPSGLRKYNNENGAENYNGEAHKVTFHITLDKAKPKNKTSDEQEYSFYKKVSKSIKENSDCIRKEYVFDDIASGTYRVTVTRSANSTQGDFTYQDRAYWDFLQSDLTLVGSSDGEVGTTVTQPIAPEITDKLTIISLKTRATEALNGTIEEFNVMAQSTCPDYEQPSSGSSKTGSSLWKPKATRNPASILLYILRDPQINRNPVEDSEIEWEDFVEYWKWCNTNKFYFDAVFTDEYTVLEIANMITQASMASLTRYNGKYGIALDNNSGAKVDFHLTPKNTMGPTQMSKPFAGNIKNLKCKFVDSQSGYSENEALISVTPEGTITYEKEQPGDTLEATFTGITDANQLRRIGRFELLKATRRVVTYSVQQDWEYLTAYPGAVGYLANDMLLYGIQSGRIRSVQYNSEGNISSVVLDESVRFDPGTRYSLVLRHNDESLGVKTYKITSEEPQTNIVIFQEPVESLEEGDLYTFSEQGKEALQVLCTSVSPSGDHSATLELVEYRPEIYTIDDQLPPWNSFITIPNGQSNPGWEKEVPPYIPPAKPGDPAKDIRLTSSATSIHSSGRGILVGENITLQCKLFNMDHITADIMPTEHEGGEAVDGSIDDTPLYTTITWDGNGLSLTDTEDPLVKIIDLQSDEAFEYIRQKGNIVVEVSFTNTDGKTYSDSLTLPIIYDGKNSEYLGSFDYLPESTLAGEPLLEGDWFLVKKSFEDEQGNKYTVADVYEYYPENQETPWQLSQNASKIAQTLPDMAKINMEDVNNENNPGRQFFQRIAANQAFINSLVAQTITIPIEGAIQSASYENPLKSGFSLDGKGTLTSRGGSINGLFCSGDDPNEEARLAIHESESIRQLDYHGTAGNEDGLDIVRVTGNDDIEVKISVIGAEIKTEDYEAVYKVGDLIAEKDGLKPIGRIVEDKGSWDGGWRYLIAANDDGVIGAGYAMLGTFTTPPVIQYCDGQYADSRGHHESMIMVGDKENPGGYQVNPFNVPSLAEQVRDSTYGGYDDWFIPTVTVSQQCNRYILNGDADGRIFITSSYISGDIVDNAMDASLVTVSADGSKQSLVPFTIQEQEFVDGLENIDYHESDGNFYVLPYRLLSDTERYTKTRVNGYTYQIGRKADDGTVIWEEKPGVIYMVENEEITLPDTGVTIKFSKAGIYNVGDYWHLAKVKRKAISVKDEGGEEYLSANDGVVTAGTLVVAKGHDGKGNNLELLLDSNQIESRTDDDKSAAKLHLQHNGGDLQVGHPQHKGKTSIYGPLVINHDTDNGDEGNPNFNNSPLYIRYRDGSGLLIDHNEIASFDKYGKPRTLALNCWGHNATVEVGSLLTGGTIVSNGGEIRGGNICAKGNVVATNSLRGKNLSIDEGTKNGAYIREGRLFSSGGRYGGYIKGRVTGADIHRALWRGYRHFIMMSGGLNRNSSQSHSALIDSVAGVLVEASGVTFYGTVSNASQYQDPIKSFSISNKSSTTYYVCVFW